MRNNPVYTSMLEAITQPRRWGFEIVDIFFGEVRPRVGEGRQEVAIKGDILRSLSTGELFEFQGREGNELLLGSLVTGEIERSPRALPNRGSRGGFSQAERASLPRRGFVFPKRRSWPLHDEAHGEIAIQYMKRGFGRRSDYPRVAAAVGQRYPQLAREARKAAWAAQRNPRTSLAYGQMPALFDFQRKWAKHFSEGEAYRYELKGQDARTAERCGVPTHSSKLPTDRHTTASCSEVYWIISRLIACYEAGDEEAGNLASGFLATLGFEWI